MSAKRTAAASHKWEFSARFRRHAFGWRSRPAIQRIKEAVSEIKQVGRRDLVIAAEGAVLQPSMRPTGCTALRAVASRNTKQAFEIPLFPLGSNL